MGVDSSGNAAKLTAFGGLHPERARNTEDGAVRLHPNLEIFVEMLSTGVHVGWERVARFALGPASRTNLMAQVRAAYSW